MISYKGIRKEIYATFGIEGVEGGKFVPEKPKICSLKASAYRGTNLSFGQRITRLSIFEIILLVW